MKATFFGWSEASAIARRACASVLLLVGSFSALTAPAHAAIDPVYVERFEKAFKACDTAHQHDPDDKDLGPHELGKNELAWAECAYAAVRTHLRPHTRIPEMYDHIIARHKAMTKAIAAGTMTRTARAIEIDRISASIRNQEMALSEGTRLRHEAIENAIERQKKLIEIQRMQDRASDMMRSMGQRLR